MKIKMYHDRKETPLAYHTFLRFVSLPLTFFLALLRFAFSSVPLSYYNYSVNYGALIDTVYYLFVIIITLVCFVGFFKWAPYAWYGINAFLVVNIIYNAIVLLAWAAAAPDQTARPLGQFIVTLIYGALVGLYYWKRKGLFIPTYPLPQDAQSAAFEQALAKEYPSYQKEADTQDAQVPPPAALPPIAYCRKCGAMLIPDSSFCAKCGTPVIKE